jgi:hypothetical protein
MSLPSGSSRRKAELAATKWLTHTGKEVPPSGVNPNSPLPALKPKASSLKPQA